MSKKKENKFQELLAMCKEKPAYLIGAIAVLVLVVLVIVLIAVNSHKKPKEEPAKIEKNQKVETVEEEEEPKVETSEVDFASLTAQNDDVYAYIKIPNTVIDYPILQSTPKEGEDFYLDRGLNKKHDPNGMPYSQMYNTKDFSDFCTVVYGHQCRKTGLMFNNLHKYKDAKFFADNSEYTVYTVDNRKLTFKVFAAFTYDNRLILGYFGNFQNDSTKEAFLKDIKKFATSNGNYDADNAANKDDKMLVLSTCTGDHSERYLVVAKIVKDETVEPFDAAKSAKN